jgi:hypothetical protein
VSAQSELGVEVTNETKSLQVEGTRISNGILMISLKNVGNKTIISYEMIHEDTDRRMIVQVRPHDNVLKPGGSDIQSWSQSRPSV